jgi:hypothetical protein
VLQIRRSKTDQDGKGAEIPVPRGGKLKPVAALEAWLKAAGITEGPIVPRVDRHGNVGAARCSDRSVARIVKRAFAPPASTSTIFSGHSLRAGFVTTALDRQGRSVQDHGHHRPQAKVDTLKIYDRRENGFDDHAGITGAVARRIGASHQKLKAANDNIAGSR